MPLPREYAAESCPIARSLEIIGERWTLLIVRDAFYGVRRFGDFHEHLGIPKAVLAERLALLTDEGVLSRVSASRGRGEYVLTEKGRRLWPTLWSLITWGNENYLDRPLRRAFRHLGCGGTIRTDSVCAKCGQQPEPGDLVVHPPRSRTPPDGVVSQTLGRPHRLLKPIRGSAD
jgi:DNA-binding HxlR family transcriptional regulator